MSRHNLNAGAPPELTLSEVARSSRNATRRLERRCRRCGAPFLAARTTALYCGATCRVAAHRAELAGAPVAELRAAASVAGDAVARPAADDLGSGLTAPVAADGARLAVLPDPVRDHDHNPRLCATCVARAHAELRPAPRATVSAELVADTIRRHGGDVWHAVNEHGIGYRHALAIRAGWRGDGRWAEPIPYVSRGITNGRRNGWSGSGHELRVLEGGDLERLEADLAELRAVGADW